MPYNSSRHRIPFKAMQIWKLRLRLCVSWGGSVCVLTNHHDNDWSFPHIGKVRQPLAYLLIYTANICQNRLPIFRLLVRKHATPFPSAFAEFIFIFVHFNLMMCWNLNILIANFDLSFTFPHEISNLAGQLSGSLNFASALQVVFQRLFRLKAVQSVNHNLLL